MELKKDETKCQMKMEVEFMVKKNWRRPTGVREQDRETNRRRRKEKSMKQHTHRSETVHTLHNGQRTHPSPNKRARISREDSALQWITRSPHPHPHPN